MLPQRGEGALLARTHACRLVFRRDSDRVQLSEVPPQSGPSSPLGFTTWRRRIDSSRKRNGSSAATGGQWNDDERGGRRLRDALSHTGGVVSDKAVQRWTN